MSETTDQQPTEPIHVETVISIMLEQMAAIAWQKLGLQHDPITQKLEKDVTQAKLAIDVTAGLAGYLEPSLDEDDKRRVHGLIRDLRINFVEQSKETKS